MIASPPDPLTEDIVTTTPRIWKSQTQVNTSDAPVAPGGTNGQFAPEIAQLQDGGYVVVWTDSSRTYNADGTAVVGQRYNSAGNKVGGEVYLSPSISDEQFSPAVTALPNGNIAVAFVDRFPPGVSAVDDNIVVRIFDSALNYIKTDVIDVGANQTGEPSIMPSATATTSSPIRCSTALATAISSRAWSTVPPGWWAANSTSTIKPTTDASRSLRHCPTATSWRSIRTRTLAAQLTPTSPTGYSPTPACRRSPTISSPGGGFWRRGGNRSGCRRTPRRRLCRGVGRRRCRRCDRDSGVHHFQRKHSRHRQHSR
jgi:hypothetical protein